MKKIWLLCLGLIFLWSCESGVQNTPVINNNNVREIKIVSANRNADGSYTYNLLLPIVWEDSLNQDWSAIGVQVNNGDINILTPNVDGSNTYQWQFTTPNSDVFVNFGHYRFIGFSSKVVWANANNIVNSLYYVEKGSVKTIGITFRNGGISPVDPSSLTQLQAVMDLNLTEAKIGVSISFNGARSTAQALPVSKIVDYIWEFGDGATANGNAVAHSYSVQGDYTVKLTVLDNLNNVSSTTRTVHIYKMAFPANTLIGGDEYIQVAEDRYAGTITIYVNLSLTQGNHGKPFWWGTTKGVGFAWEFVPINVMPLNEDWGYIVLPFSGREQFEFNYSDYYESLDNNNCPTGVNWSHLSLSYLYDSNKGHYSMLVSNQQVSRP